MDPARYAISRRLGLAPGWWRGLQRAACKSGWVGAADAERTGVCIGSLHLAVNQLGIEVVRTCVEWYKDRIRLGAYPFRGTRKPEGPPPAAAGDAVAPAAAAGEAVAFLPPPGPLVDVGAGVGDLFD